MKLLALFLFVALVAAEKVRYDGYQTIRVEPRDDNQLAFLHSLDDDLEETLSFWTHPRTTARPTDIMVKPRFIDEFKELLDSKKIKYSVMIDDVQTLIDSQAQSLADAENVDWHRTYHTYEEIQDRVFDITSKHSSISSPVRITTSYEGRPINGIKIATGEPDTKKVIYWQGGIHAREWISPATVMYITESLLELYGTDPEVTEILDTFDFYIIPSLNVDGYSYTWTNDRLWRKTRSRHGNNVCAGVDPNRNYDMTWSGPGASGSSCSYTYYGPYAHSEPEVAGSTQFLMDLKDKQDVICFIDFHSYTQLWLYPWSYSASVELPQETDDHEGAALAATSALTSVYGTQYTAGPSAQTLYAASGCSLDWGFDVLGAKYSYVVELRDTGEYGFVLPEDQILPSGVETLEAVIALCNYIKSTEGL